MATQSPLRGKSGENRSAEISYDQRDRSREYRNVTEGHYYRRADESMQYKRNEFPAQAEYVEYHNEKENVYDGASARYRSRSPANYAGQQTRQYQYQSRMNVTPLAPQPQVIVRKVAVNQHHEFFVSELQNDISELRSRQRDFGALKEQFKYLQEQYKQVQLEKQRIETESLAQISEDRSEVDRLIRELDGLKNENFNAEEEQIKIIESITITEREVAQASGELAGLRQQSSVDDQVNLNLRKEISYQEGLVTEQKEVSHQAYKELTSLREQGLGLDRELDTQHKRISILRTEIENNDQRIQNVQGLLSSKEEAIVRTSMKIQECHQIIQEQKYTLNKLDGELGYFESQNEQHKNAQSQLFKANEYEYVQSKDNQLKCSELEVEFNKLEQDQKSVAYEIDRLKQHSEQMMRDQIDLQSEVDALDKHMANLNNQNYCLQKELEGFIQADEQVRQGLDRKQQVDQIRSKVDDVIKRSQQEVEQRVTSHKQQLQRHAVTRQEEEVRAQRMVSDRSAAAQQQFRSSQQERATSGGAVQQDMRRSYNAEFTNQARQSNSRQEAGEYQFRGAVAREQDYRVKSANNVSPARYVVEQRIAYRPEHQQAQYTRNTGYTSQYSRENYGPGERRYSPLRKEGTQVSYNNDRESNKQEEQKDNKKEDDQKKVQFADKKETVEKK